MTKFRLTRSGAREVVEVDFVQLLRDGEVLTIPAHELSALVRLADTPLTVHRAPAAQRVPLRSTDVHRYRITPG